LKRLKTYMKYKAKIQSLLTDLKTKHCMTDAKASELKTLMEQYVAGEIDIPEDEAKAVEVEMGIYGSVAVIDINGVICKRLGLPAFVMDFFGLCDLDLIDAQIKSVMNDESITAVVFNVNSPGGYVAGVQSTANLISKLTDKKETVVYSDLQNCSAAYWLSSQCNSIIGSIDAEFGSIGVYTEMWSISRALAEVGYDYRLVKVGKYKAIGNPNAPITAEDEAFVLSEVMETAKLFKESVNNRRKIDAEYMEGQTASGNKALDYNYVDGFAEDISEVIATLK
jgi:capsid assembly protease